MKRILETPTVLLLALAVPFAPRAGVSAQEVADPELRDRSAEGPRISAEAPPEAEADAVKPDVPGRILGPKPGPGKARSAVDNPYGDDPAVLTDGRRLFLWFNCYGCHGGRAGGGMGPSLRDAAWLYGKADQDIFNSIYEGRPHGMPAWGTMLPESQIWKLTAYIQSLGTADEPQPPPPNPVFRDPPPRRDVKGVEAGEGEN
jgi:cytochrome c oxidase cbb3-type subunit III